MKIAKIFRYALEYSSEVYETSFEKEVESTDSIILEAEGQALSLYARLLVIEEVLDNGLFTDEKGNINDEFKRLRRGLHVGSARLQKLMNDNEELFKGYEGTDEIDYIRKNRVNKFIKENQ